MKIGKLNSEDLKNIICDNRSVSREDVRIKSGIGEDCSVVDFGKYECVLSTDPITGTVKNIGKLAVNINCNDIASCGTEPLGILVTIMVPPNASIEDIKKIMNEIDEETKKLNVEILGGHTEVTDAVNKIIVSCTAIGKCVSGKAISSSGAKIGDDIIVTKKLCLEGTSIIVNDYYDKAKNILTSEEINEAKKYVNYLSVVNEGVIAGKFGVNSMHDITEGGVLGAVWEIASASKVGFRVYHESMPISSITKKLCSSFKIDPLRFISSGSMIITTSRGQDLVELLKHKGIESTIIGSITIDGGILVDNCNEIKVAPPEIDELFRIK
jgi:hydrogenase expression/formation protein HypE